MSKTGLYHQLIIAVGLIEKDNKILVVRRCDPENTQWHHRWGFPGGKIELNETPVEALRREIKEETGLMVSSEKLLGIHTHHWNTPKGIQQTFILLYHCTDYIGEVSLNKENDAFVWEDPETIILRSDLLEGNVQMLQELFLKTCTVV
jgi:8-oxo-dGTP diphosphatase